MLHHTHDNRVFSLSDVNSCIEYATSGARLDTCHSRLNTNPPSSDTIDNSELLHIELGETQLPWISYNDT